MLDWPAMAEYLCPLDCGRLERFTPTRREWFRCQDFYRRTLGASSPCLRSLPFFMDVRRGQNLP